jgi:hypothetical protein
MLIDYCREEAQLCSAFQTWLASIIGSERRFEYHSVTNKFSNKSITSFVDILMAISDAFLKDSDIDTSINRFNAIKRETLRLEQTSLTAYSDLPAQGL